MMTKNRRHNKPKPRRLPRGAKALLGALKDAGWTQCRLAKEMGVTPPTVSRWLTGERVPNRAHAGKLLRLLKVPLEVWL